MATGARKVKITKTSYKYVKTSSSKQGRVPKAKKKR